jgi:putative cardiolipin synthase
MKYAFTGGAGVSGAGARGGWRCWPALAALAAVLLGLSGMTGCASLPPPDTQRPESRSMAAPADAPLPTLARELAIPDRLSAVRPMPLPQDALAARVAMMAQARTSIDLQTYHLADDSTGRLMLRGLRDAAARGVRVRLLLDDFYTTGMDDLLLGLAAHPNVELRLFNPWASTRGWPLGRLLQLAGDFSRLNHRMHNKLFVVDGAFAIAGGRNLADDYFLRSKQGNFIDFDLLLAGAVMRQVADHFDSYWNSERVWPLQSVARSRMGGDELRAYFEVATAPATGPDAVMPALPPTPSSSADPLSADALRPSRPLPERGHLGFFIARAGAHADPPVKRRGDPDAPDGNTVAAQLLDMMDHAQREVLMVSPYFVPGRVGMDGIRRLRERGVSVGLVTNATGSSDEPIVSLGYERHRVEMLRLGVRLYEVSSAQLKRDETLRTVLGSSTGRLHAKMGFIDRRLFLAGSLNLDARSALINTEIGVRVESPELVKALLDFYRLESATGVYELKLQADGHGIRWVGLRDGREVSEDTEPEYGTWLRFKMWLWSLVVSEELL